MPARRSRPLVALGAALALVGLSGCEKPTPIVTLFSGSTSLYDEAFVYCFDDQDPTVEPGSEQACRYDAERLPSVLQVRRGDEVLVDVDKDLADGAWIVALSAAGSEVYGRTEVQTEHTVRVLPDFSRGERQQILVQKLDSEADDARPVGTWLFDVVPG